MYTVYSSVQELRACVYIYIYMYYGLNALNGHGNTWGVQKRWSQVKTTPTTIQQRSSCCMSVLKALLQLFQDHRIEARTLRRLLPQDLNTSERLRRGVPREAGEPIDA